MYAAIFTNETERKDTLHEIASQFSPLIEEIGAHAVVLDIAGNGLLIGAPHKIARAISLAAGQRGLIVNLALADNPDAALCAAQFLRGITIIPPGEEAEHLAALPIEALFASLRAAPPGRGGSAKRERDEVAEIIETLKRWGIGRFQDFVDLPEADTAERLGPQGVKLQQFARGVTSRPLANKRQAPTFERSIELEDSIELVEPLSFILRRLITQLCEQMRTSAFAIQELRLDLKLEDKTECELTLRLPFPTLNDKALLSLLMLRIKSESLESPIVALSLSAEPVKPRTTQPGLFEEAAPEPEKLQLTLAKIEKLVGADNVGSPMLLDTHRPGAFTINRFDVLRASRLNTKRVFEEGVETTKARLGFRMFRPPLKAIVRFQSDKPYSIKAKAGRSGPAIQGSVVELSGPWRVSGEWWEASAWERDDWDIALSDGHVYRVYRDLSSDGWFIEGVYD